MSNIKRAEEHVYEAVRRGELQIDLEGRIWRDGKRRVSRWTGQVETVKCKRVRGEKQLPTGYLMVRAMVDQVRMSALAHRLVWFYLHGRIPDGMVINHKNGRKEDNRPSNLEVVTPQGNALHSVHVLKKGKTLRQYGESNDAAKLTMGQVAQIRERRASGEKLKKLAKDFGVSEQQVSKIARGERRNFG
jgi:hypothetical protein